MDEEKGTLAQYINRSETTTSSFLAPVSSLLPPRISMHVTKVAMVVDAGFVIFFVVALVKLEVWVESLMKNDLLRRLK